MSEAEKRAIRESFSDDLTGLTIAVKGLVGTHNKTLAKSGGDAVYRALASRDWSITHEAPPSPISARQVIDELTGWIVTVQGHDWGWDYTEVLSREGAEAISDRIDVRGWHIGKL